jgi:hypothetical protein
MATSKVSMGQIVSTPNAMSTLDAQDVQAAIGRHSQGDWGDLCEEDRQTNERALSDGLRLFSRFQDRHGTKFYIITEADRSVTTVLLPDEY